MCVCVCVCVCVCLGGSTEACLPNKRVSWVQIPMQEYLPSNNTIISAHSSVKRVPGLVLHNGCVSLSTNGSCGTSSIPTPAMGGTVGTSCKLLARALGVCVVPAHHTCLVHR